MRIVGLMCPDKKQYPNIALMRIAGFHNLRGDIVEWYNSSYGDVFDLCYASSVFTYSDKSDVPPTAFTGGSGFNKWGILPEHIANTQPDYSIYPDCGFSIQRFSIGCKRHCKFCIVHDKEGEMQPVAPMELNPKGEWIDVIDNDFFGNPEWEKAVMYLIETQQPVSIQNVSVRDLTERHAFWLNRLKHFKQTKMAWDNPKENLLPKFREVAHWIKPYKVMVYVLVGFDSTMVENLYRINELNALGYDPFVMVYRDRNNSEQPRELQRLARWCNKKQHRGISWDEYCKERGDRV